VGEIRTWINRPVIQSDLVGMGFPLVAEKSMDDSIAVRDQLSVSDLEHILGPVLLTASHVMKIESE